MLVFGLVAMSLLYVTPRHAILVKLPDFGCCAWFRATIGE